MGTAVETRQRLAVAASLAFTVAAGLWLTSQLGELLMTEGSSMKMADGMVMDGGGQSSSLLRAGIMFLMWLSMMMAMMLPSAVPAFVSYAAISRKLEPRTSMTVFALGYATDLDCVFGLRDGATASDGRLCAAGWYDGFDQCYGRWRRYSCLQVFIN